MIIIKVDLHSHGPERLDEMRLIRKHQAWMIRIEDLLGDGIEHPVAEAAFEHPDYPPHASFGAMLLAQSGGQRVLIKYRGALVG